MSKAITTIALGLLISVAPFTVLSQVMAPEVEKPVNWVKELSDIAGGAAYCNFDMDKQELFLNLAHAKLAAVANDKVEQVVSIVAFNNALSKTSSNEPMGGCATFEAIFNNALTRLQ